MADNNQSENFTLDHRDIVEVLSALHRGDGSHVGFMRKNDSGDLENLFSIEATEIEEQFPAISRWLIKDAYFTVNSMYRTAPYPNRTTGLPCVWRKEKHLRYLNACYADLDVGRDCGTPAQMMSWRDAAAAVGNLMDDNVIPQTSIFARSGRGLYLFWCLHDEQDPTQPPRSLRGNLDLYKAVNQAISECLQELAADFRVVDAARNTRAANTRHGQTQKPAKYMVQLDDDGRCYSYTLPELAELFGVSNTRARLSGSSPCMVYGQDWTEEVEGRREWSPVRKTQKPGSAPGRIKGQRSLNEKRAQDLLRLEQSRGGWVKGQRKFCLSLYANFLRGVGKSQPDTLRAVSAMACNCQPPYPSDRNDTPLRAIVEEAFETLRSYSNESLCKWLRITPELAVNLGLVTILPLGVMEQRQLPSGGKREAQRQSRHVQLRELIASQGIQSSRHLAQDLRAMGCKVSDWTVNRDLNELGYPTSTPARKAGRRSG